MNRSCIEKFKKLEAMNCEAFDELYAIVEDLHNKVDELSKKLNASEITETPKCSCKEKHDTPEDEFVVKGLNTKCDKPVTEPTDEEYDTLRKMMEDSLKKCSFKREPINAIPTYEDDTEKESSDSVEVVTKEWVGPENGVIGGSFFVKNNHGDFTKIPFVAKVDIGVVMTDEEICRHYFD